MEITCDLGDSFSELTGSTLEMVWWRQDGNREVSKAREV
jgi:hypothetical protein